MASSAPGQHLHLRKGELWALVAAVAYGLNNIFVRVAVRDYDLNDLMGVSLRAAPTFVFALLMGLRTRRRNPRATSPVSDWRLATMLIGYGLLTFVVANPLLFAALRAGGVLVASPVTGTQALWAALIAALFLHESLNRAMVGGMVITVVHFIPEPGLLLLLGSGVVGLALVGRKRMRS
jgi:drug/metabolite transporter (DMT)-like permease